MTSAQCPGCGRWRITVRRAGVNIVREHYKRGSLTERCEGSGTAVAPNLAREV